MTRLVESVLKIRSKNAGPFWLTIDVFCGSTEVFGAVSKSLDSGALAQRFRIPETDLKRFDIPELNVVKISLPRPKIQGTVADRDMHGASFAQILGDLEI